MHENLEVILDWQHIEKKKAGSLNMREIMWNASEQNFGNALFSVWRGYTYAAFSHFRTLVIFNFLTPPQPHPPPSKPRQRPQQLIHSQTTHPGKYDSDAATENSAVKRLPQAVATEVRVCNNVTI